MELCLSAKTHGGAPPSCSPGPSKENAVVVAVEHAQHCVMLTSSKRTNIVCFLSKKHPTVPLTLTRQCAKKRKRGSITASISSAHDQLHYYNFKVSQTSFNKIFCTSENFS